MMSKILVISCMLLVIISTSLADSLNMESVGFCPTPGRANGIYLLGDYAYVTTDEPGTLTIIDVSDPENPFEKSHILLDGRPEGIYVSGKYAYVACLAGGFQVIDVSDNENPEPVDYLDIYAAGVYVVGRYAFLACPGEGLRIIDVHNPGSAPNNPKKGIKEVDFYPTVGSPRRVYVDKGYAYVATKGGGLRVIDVTKFKKDKKPLKEVGHYDEYLGGFGIYVQQPLAYLAADNDGGLQIIDISDVPEEEELQSLGPWDTPGRAVEVFVVGQIAYVADLDGGLRVIDVSDPEYPSEIGYYETPICFEVVADEEFVYITEPINKGLYILRYTGPMPIAPDVSKAPAAPKVAELGFAFPSIANPDIWIPFSLSEENQVLIRIYSVSGQLVRTLDLGSKVPGDYMTKEKAAYWDGRTAAGEKVASGLYFYNMQAGEYSATRKLLMVK